MRSLELRLDVRPSATGRGSTESGTVLRREDAGADVAASADSAPSDTGFPGAGSTVPVQDSTPTTDPGDSACAAANAAAKQVPPELFIMHDPSGSTRDTTSAGQTKWPTAQAPQQGFMSDPSTSGIGVGSRYFDIEKSGGGGITSAGDVADWGRGDRADGGVDAHRRERAEREVRRLHVRVAVPPLAEAPARAGEQDADAPGGAAEGADSLGPRVSGG